jgi:hypothetical protein
VTASPKEAKGTIDIVIDRLEKLLLDMAGVSRRFDRLEEFASAVAPTQWKECVDEFEPTDA